MLIHQYMILIMEFTCSMFHPLNTSLQIFSLFYGMYVQQSTSQVEQVHIQVCVKVSPTPLMRLRVQSLHSTILNCYNFVIM